MSDQNGTDPPFPDAVKEIIKGLAGERAYLLVFGLALILAAGAFASRLTSTQVLAGFSIFVVERRKRLSVPVQSPAQRKRLLAVPEQEVAIRGLLGGLVDNDTDTYFVYSSTSVEYFLDYADKRIEYPFTEEERRVTAIPDAHGIGMIQSLLDLAGKRERLHILTSHVFRPEYWESNLILIGSRNANQQTDVALRKMGSPFRFNKDVSAIVELQESGDGQWPRESADLKRRDYAVVAKGELQGPNQQIVYLVLAGIGAFGTLAACHYLQRRVIDLYGRFERSPFACVLSLNREEGFTSVVEEKAKRLAVTQV